MKHFTIFPLKTLIKVAPLAGAWIETAFLISVYAFILASLPLRERGLKLDVLIFDDPENESVAPLAGAWIETGEK